MDDIYALLNINPCLIKDFPLQANNIVDHQTELAIKRCVRSLKEVEERMMSDKSVRFSQQSIDEIIQKVIDNVRAGNRDMSIWSIRELRIVSYYLMKLQGDEEVYLYALSLLENNWRDMFFNGLSFYCLDTWNMIEPELRASTCELLRDKLTAYQGSNRKYVVMKNHANLFDEVGPLRLATMIIQKNLDIKEAPSLFSNKPSTIIQSFYSDVIVNYCKLKNIMNIGEIESIFNVHQQERTKKLVLADLVIRVNHKGDELMRTQICKFVNRMLGDVTLSSTWAPFLGSTAQEAQKLRSAKDLVNLWFNQRIIETFFEVCVQDRYRKEFWLDYVDHLSSFRIVGSSAVKKLLLSDSRIGSMFLKYFIETDSATSQTSALVLFIKNKMLVEFSDTGALYAYNKGHRMVRNVLDRRISISSTNDLKIPSMDQIITKGNMGYLYFEQQGRMTHQGDWQSRLREWMRRMVLSADVIDVSSFESDDNDLFRAKPVPKEEFKSSISSAKAVTNTIPKDLPKDIKLKDDKQNGTSQILPVVYEENIWFAIASKWFFNNKCRVISNRDGFYLQIAHKGKFVKLAKANADSDAGSVWIKKPVSKGWTILVHFFCGTERTIGFLKQNGNNVLFKRAIKQEKCMTIEL